MTHIKPDVCFGIPPTGNGSAVLVLHAWWGLSDTTVALDTDSLNLDRSQVYNQAAASIAWDRTLAFLKRSSTL